MYVWEMIGCRLRGEGWSVWHVPSQAADGWSYEVHFHRPGISGQANGPTLTEAYAEAARLAHGKHSPIPAPLISSPRFELVASLAR